MSSYELVELTLDPDEAEPTLEDEFTMTLVGKDIDKLKDPESLKIVSKQLLKVIVNKQAMIRALCKRLIDLESDTNLRKIKIQ